MDHASTPHLRSKAIFSLMAGSDSRANACAAGQTTISLAPPAYCDRRVFTWVAHEAPGPPGRVGVALETGNGYPSAAYCFGRQSLTSFHVPSPIRCTINSGVGFSPALKGTTATHSDRPRYRYTEPSQRAARQPRRRGRCSDRSIETFDTVAVSSCITAAGKGRCAGNVASSSANDVGRLSGSMAKPVQRRSGGCLKYRWQTTCGCDLGTINRQRQERTNEYK